MAQLQLYISKTIRGFKSIVNINPSEEVVRQIRDYSAALETISYDASKHPELFLVSYISTGLLLSVIRPVSDAGLNNHYAATLCIPNGAIVPAERLSELLRKISALISDGQDPDQDSLAHIRAILANDYAIDNITPKHSVFRGTSYAVARVDSEDAPNFADYIAEAFYQPQYSKYAGILLYRSADGITLYNDTNDVTNKQLAHMVTLMPPAKSFNGFTPYIDHQPFSEPIWVADGSTIKINWCHSSFEPFIQEYTVSGNGTTPSTPNTSKAQRKISRNTFYVTEQGTQNTITDFSVTVNDREINDQEVFTYSELTHANVQIMSPGYSSYSGILDLAKTTQALVQLRIQHKTYRFDLPLDTPEPVEAIHIYIKTKKPITRCPIEGYNIIGDTICEGSNVTNRLVYSGGKSSLKLFIPVITGLICTIAGFLLGWIAFAVPETKNIQEPTTEIVETPTAATTGLATAIAENATSAPAQTQPESAPVAEPEPTPEPVAQTSTAEPDYIAGAEYLQSHKNWNRAELENIPGMSGLFDDLNTYNFDRILTYWQPLLEGRSATFDAVIRACRGAATKRDPHLAPHDPTYAKDGDDINWRTYTYWVDP